MKRNEVISTIDDSKSISEVYDKIADDFDSKRKHPWEEVTSFISKITPGKIFLDLGSGNGRHTRVLLDKNIDTICYDLSFNILRISKENELKDFENKICGMINGDASNLSFKSSSLDGFLMIAVFHHIKTNDQRKVILNEIYRVLKTDSIGLVSCWLNTHPRFRKNDLVEQVSQEVKNIIVPWIMPNGERIDRYYYLFDEDELISLIEDAGLKVVKSKISHHNIFLTVKKE